MSAESDYHQDNACLPESDNFCNSLLPKTAYLPFGAMELVDGATVLTK